MIEGEQEIPIRPREQIVDRWIKTITVLPSEEAYLQLASLKAKDLTSLVERIHQKSLGQEGVDFWAELGELTEKLNGFKCQIAEGQEEGGEVLGSGAANTLWLALQKGNKLIVIDNYILVLKPKEKVK